MAPDLVAAIVLGLLGAGHCIGMCGGISAALAFALGPQCPPLRRNVLLLLYSTGRVASYTLMGALAGGAIDLAVPARHDPTLRLVAGALLVYTGLVLAGWPGLPAPLERVGRRVWRHLAPLAARLGPPDRAATALLAGAAWGWLPCGLVYGALGWAGSAGDAARGALLMTGFGIGTVPAVMASGVFADGLRKILQRRGPRALAALCVCLFGVWTIGAALGGHGPQAHHH